MKSLKEEVNTIINANTSKAAKRQALIKIGVTPYEASLMLANVTGPIRGQYTFGVEIECGVSRSRFSEAASANNFTYDYLGYYGHEDRREHFRFMSDSSVHIDGSTECVSPVLKGTDGKKALALACKTLNQAGAKVNRTCGLHVHIGAADLTDEQYCNVFVNYYYLEGIIDSFMAESRRRDNNGYCSSIADHAGLLVCLTRSDVRGELRSRYHKINAESYLNHKTIEFRQHQGTTDYNKIINWVTFCGKLVMWSKSNRLTAAVTSINDIPFLTASEKAFFTDRAQSL